MKCFAAYMLIRASFIKSLNESMPFMFMGSKGLICLSVQQGLTVTDLGGVGGIYGARRALAAYFVK